jgi:cytochrome c-type biogenesis protein CcmF
VLGWGGYFAWDPVENASLLPWLTATAYIHSLQTQEKRGMLKLWNLTLLIATFALTLLATFLTRSGIISSVHAFSDGLTGPALLAFIALVLVVSLAAVAWRGEQLRGEGILDRVLSRESAFLANNLLLVGLMLTVLVGTTFPLLAEALDGTQLSVGEPYFNQTAVPILLALLLLMGIGPALPWRRTAGTVLRRRLGVPALAALATAVTLAVAGVHRPETLAALALAALVVFQALWDLARLSVRRSLARQRRRAGGQIVHLGIALIAVGIAVSSSYRSETDLTLARGQSFRAGGHLVRFAGTTVEQQPQRRVVRADLLVDGGTRLTPALNYYAGSSEAIASPAIRESLGRDLYTVLTWASTDGRRATVRVFLEPLVSWIWIGAAVVLAGAALAAAPSLHRRAA